MNDLCAAYAKNILIASILATEAKDSSKLIPSSWWYPLITRRVLFMMIVFSSSCLFFNNYFKVGVELDYLVSYHVVVVLLARQHLMSLESEEIEVLEQPEQSHTLNPGFELLCSKTIAESSSNVTFVVVGIKGLHEVTTTQIRIEQYFLMTDYALWEVILNGDSPPPTRSVEGVETPYPPTSIDEKLARKNELKARGTLLMALPNEHQLKFNSYKTAKSLMEAIENRFGVNTVHGVFAASSKTNASNLSNVDSLSDAVIYSFFASQSNSPRCDGLGYDWSDQVKDGPTNFALMTYTSSSSLSSLKSDTEVSTCSKACLKSYETLKEHYDNLTKDFNKSQFNLGAYKASLASVEARLEVYKKNEAVFEDDIKILKLDVMLRDKVITELRQKFEKAKKEKDDLKLTLEKFKGSSKNLSRLLDSQQSDKSKTNLGYDNQGVDSQVLENQVNDKYKAGEGYHAVPPPYTGNFMPPRPDLSFAGLDDFAFKSKISETVTSVHETKTSASKTSKESMEKPKIARRNFVLIVAITHSGKVSVTTAKQSSLRASTLTSTARYVNTAATRPTVNGGLTSLFAKTTTDESDLWHRKPGHINFKTMNKLMRGNLVRGFLQRFLKMTIHVLPVKKESSTKPPFCQMKGIKREFSVSRTPQQNGVVKRNNRTQIEAVRTMLAYLLLPTTFWVEAVNTACYVQNKVLVTKPHNKTPYELLIDRSPNIDFMKPFGCHVTILNTLDHLGKFEGKADEGFLVGYSINRRGPEWLFDIDSLTKSMNYDIQSSDDKDVDEAPGKRDEGVSKGSGIDNQERFNSSTQDVNIAKPSINTANTNINIGSLNNNIVGSNDPRMPNLEETSIFDDVYDDREVGVEADINNLELSTIVSPIPTTRVHKDHPKEQIIRDLNLATQTKRTINFSEENAMAIHALIDPSWIKAMQEELLQFKLQKVWTLVDLPNGKRVIGTKWVFRNKKDERGIVVRNKTRLVAQENRFRRGTIDKTLFIKKDRGDILLVQVYVDDIIVGSTNKFLCYEFEQMMHKRFQMSSMEELTFFLRLQVNQKDDGIFISQDKYVADILKKFDFATVKTASTPMEPNKALIKDAEAKDVDVHLYRLMIGSLMYLTASRPDIIFVVYAYARFQVTPKTSHLHAVKKIFRYLRGQPKLGLWYPRDSPFNLEAFSDSDYVVASLDRKSTTGGCQFLGKRLISWQCKKQTIVANFTTEAEYVAAASCYGQVLWIQNQMLDYGLNFINTKIYIDNESTIHIVKNLVFHSKTKHIEIRHHFIKDSYEKKLIQVIKIHTDHNVIDLLIKDFDVSRFNFLVASIGLLNL
uniref:Putative ribonuclease H-like domain-containing protein n=1 Tax=Tanacetum cinerariifolium TaxID=118510 RepID=A0A6L2JW49_TANCI|nr:putative ribonuclease H-like domain-containing protein [Tanacetum cinerariifolium]